MGWFGILADSADINRHFSVRECHINWWALPTPFPGRRLFIMDVGIHISADKRSPVEAFILALPIDAEKVRWNGNSPCWVKDLYDVSNRERVQRQIFGCTTDSVTLRITGVDPNIEIESPTQSKIILAPINATGVQRLGEDLSVLPLDGPYRSDFSLWRIPLAQPIPIGEARFVRLRFSAFRAGNVWRWDRIWLRRVAAQVDLRVSDVLEAKHHDSEDDLLHRTMPIDHVCAFFTVPSRLKLRASSPPARMIRRLEVGQWSEYLTGTRYVGQTRDLDVYHWKSTTRNNIEQETDKKISKDDPYRIFADYCYDFSVPASVAMARVVVSVIAALLIGAWFARFHPSLPTLNEVRDNSVSGVLLMGGVFAVLTSVRLLSHFVSDRFRSIRLWGRRVERCLLKPFTFIR